MILPHWMPAVAPTNALLHCSFIHICESWLKFYLIQVCKPCQYALVEAVEPFKLHLMSMSYIYEVFEHLLRFWMGYGFTFTPLPPQTVTDASPEFWELAEILRDESMQTMPIHFGWGCRTFWTACHVRDVHIWGVWAPSLVLDGI